MIPGSGIIDWAAVDHALATVGYKGVFMLEVTERVASNPVSPASIPGG